jgi:hypothetical protein
MKLFCAILSLVFVAIFASACFAVPTYRIETLGLTDAEHTKADGTTENSVSLGYNGTITGTSSRYNGGSTWLGTTAWRYNGSTPINIGLTGSEYINSNGWSYSSISAINEHGLVLGASTRFVAGSPFSGGVPWLNDGSATVPIGLFDAVHTRDDGSRNSRVGQLNAAEQATGSSDCFLGGECQTAWLYSDSVITPLGLTDTEHTGGYGNRYSYTRSLNDAGMVAGRSWRFGNEDQYLGDSAWLYDGSNTTRIGFYDNEHTRNNGFSSSEIGALNDAGQVIGTSRRYNGGSVQVGQSAWVYDGSTTRNLGFVDSDHTLWTDGTRYSAVSSLNKAGQAIGYSRRYVGNADGGQSAWLFDGTAIKRIGLTGSGFTSNSGRQSSEAAELNEAGQIIGQSDRMSGFSTNLGKAAWFYDGSNTIEIGLDGAEYVRNDGYRFSESVLLNQAGTVVGTSTLYNGTNQSWGSDAWLFANGVTKKISPTGDVYSNHQFPGTDFIHSLNEAGQVTGTTGRSMGGVAQGQDAWFYDPGLDQTFILQLSQRADGYARSSVQYLGEDGLVLGTYELFNGNSSRGTRAFFFTIEDGLHDLGSLVEGGLAKSGWTALTGNSFQTDQFGRIVGIGTLSSQAGTMPYLLTPITADFNNDGNVDGRDFLAWQRGESPRPLSAEDLALWQEQSSSGNTLNAVKQVSVVPEPSSLALVLGSLLLAARVRMR